MCEISTKSTIAKGSCIDVTPKTGKTYALLLAPAHLDGDAKFWDQIIWVTKIGLVIAGLWGGIRGGGTFPTAFTF